VRHLPHDNLDEGIFRQDVTFVHEKDRLHVGQHDNRAE
jgi:hypothetical protein